MEKITVVKDKTYRIINIDNNIYKGRDSNKNRTSKYIIDALGGPEILKDKEVLDLACASGAILFEVRNFIKKGTGADVDDKKLNVGKDIISEHNIENISLHNIRLEQFLVKENKQKYDCIFLLNIIHHLPKPREALDLVAEISNNLICIEAPKEGFYNPYPRDEKLPTPSMALSIADIDAHLSSRGFKLVNKIKSENQENFMGPEGDYERYVCVFEKKRKENILFSDIEDIKKLKKAFVVGPGASGKTRLLHEIYNVEIEYKGPEIIKNKVFGPNGMSLKWSSNVRDFTKEHPILYIAPDYKSKEGFKPNIDAWIEEIKNQSATAVVCYTLPNTLYARTVNRFENKNTSAPAEQYFDNFPFSYQELFEKFKNNNIEYCVYNCDF